MASDLELVNRIFSEPNLDDLEKDLRALNPHLKDSLKIFESLTKRSSSGCWSDVSFSSNSSFSSESGRLYNRRSSLSGSSARPYSTIVKGSSLSRNAPEFVPSTYAAAVSKTPGQVAPYEPAPRFVVPILNKPPVVVVPSMSKPIPDITANNMPRPPIRMTPATLKKFSSPEIVLPVFQASFQISAKASSTTSYNTHASFRKHCDFCKTNGESAEQYQSHCLKNPLTGKVICPILREYVCEVCKSTGDDAHVESKCPLNLIAKDNPALVRLVLSDNKCSYGKER